MSKLDEILWDLPDAWCPDCEHPRCAGKFMGARLQIKDLLKEVIYQAVDSMDYDYPEKSEGRRALHTLYTKATNLVDEL